MKTNKNELKPVTVFCGFSGKYYADGRVEKYVPTEEEKANLVKSFKGMCDNVVYCEGDLSLLPI